MIKQSYKRVAIVNVDDAMQVYLAVRLLIFQPATLEEAVERDCLLEN